MDEVIERSRMFDRLADRMDAIVERLDGVVRRLGDVEDLSNVLAEGIRVLDARTRR